MKVRAGPCLLSGEAVGQNPPGLPAPGAACNPPPRACGHVPAFTGPPPRVHAFSSVSLDSGPSGSRTSSWTRHAVCKDPLPKEGHVCGWEG